MFQYLMLSPIVYLVGLYLFDFEVAIAMVISYFVGRGIGMLTNFD